MKMIEQSVKPIYNSMGNGLSAGAAETGKLYTRILQKNLNEAGITNKDGFALKVDGIYGPKTQTAHAIAINKIEYGKFQKTKGAYNPVAAGMAGMDPGSTGPYTSPPQSDEPPATEEQVRESTQAGMAGIDPGSTGPYTAPQSDEPPATEEQARESTRAGMAGMDPGSTGPYTSPPQSDELPVTEEQARESTRAGMAGIDPGSTGPYTSPPQSDEPPATEDEADRIVNNHMGGVNPGDTGNAPHGSISDVLDFDADDAGKGGASATDPGSVVFTVEETNKITEEIQRKNEDLAKQQQAVIDALESVENNEDFERVTSEFDATNISEKSEYILLKYVLDDEYRGKKDSAIIGTEEYSMYEYLNFFTEEEKKVMRYYISTMEQDKANKYLSQMRPTLYARMRQSKEDYMKELSYESPAFGAVQYLMNTDKAGLATIPVIKQWATTLFGGGYAPLDLNSLFFEGAHMANAAEEGVIKRAYDDAYMTTGSENLAKYASYAASCGLDLSYIIKNTLGGLFGKAGSTASAAGKSATEALDADAPLNQVLVATFAAGVFEAIANKSGIDDVFTNIKANPDKIKSLAQEVLSKFNGLSGAQSGLSEVSDSLVNIAVLGDKSQYNQFFDGLVESGMSPEEAQKEAFVQFFMVNVALAFVDGALPEIKGEK